MVKDELAQCSRTAVASSDLEIQWQQRDARVQEAEAEAVSAKSLPDAIITQNNTVRQAMGF